MARSRWMLLLPLTVSFALYAQNGPRQLTGQTIWEDHHDTSPPLRDLMAEYIPIFLPAHEQPDDLPYPVHIYRNRPDGALQSENLPANPPTAAGGPVMGLNFEGQDFDSTCRCIPPDTNGAVGATQYVQAVNTVFTVYDKGTGNAIAGPVAINALWAGFTGGDCAGDDDGDVTVLFDKAAQVWVFQQFDLGPEYQGPYYDCIAVSTTSDATGSYNRYAFPFGDVNYPDYPKLGVWPAASPGAPQGVYLGTYNIFPNAQYFLGPAACAYDRNAMLAGNTAVSQCFILTGSFDYGPLLPSDMDGFTTPSANEPGYFMQYDYSGQAAVDLFQLAVNFPSSSTVTGPIAISVPAFTPYGTGSADIPENSGDNTLLDSLSDLPMYRLAWRNIAGVEHLNFNHTVTGTGGAAAIRWYDITNPNTTPVVAQAGTFSPDANYRWMGSTAMDAAGDQAVGFSQSSATTNPSIWIAGRTPSDPAGTLEPQINIIDGGGSQDAITSRWGDYSAMQIDPVDDCTFWYTQEYIQVTGYYNWNTRIANFKFPGCGGQAQTISFSTNAPASAVYNSSFTVAASASSGLPVTYTSAGACTNSGGTYTMTSGTGTCSVIVSQMGNGQYLAAPTVTQITTATLASQTISFAALPKQMIDSPPFTISATASSGLTVSFASTTGKVCTVSGSTVTLVKTGLCSITASQSGNTDYAAAAPVAQSFEVTKAAQTITFAKLPSRKLGATPFTISATASSGLTVKFASTTAAICAVSGDTVTLVAAGHCTIKATQAGNATYAAAKPVSQGFKVKP